MSDTLLEIEATVRELRHMPPSVCVWQDRLCFEVDAHEWDELCAELEKVQTYTRDSNPAKPADMHIMGLHVRKRIGVK